MTASYHLDEFDRARGDPLQAVAPVLRFRGEPDGPSELTWETDQPRQARTGQTTTRGAAKAADTRCGRLDLHAHGVFGSDPRHHRPTCGCRAGYRVDVLPVQGIPFPCRFQGLPGGVVRLAGTTARDAGDGEWTATVWPLSLARSVGRTAGADQVFEPLSGGPGTGHRGHGGLPVPALALRPHVGGRRADREHNVGRHRQRQRAGSGFCTGFNCAAAGLDDGVQPARDRRRSDGRRIRTSPALWLDLESELKKYGRRVISASTQ